MRTYIAFLFFLGCYYCFAQSDLDNKQLRNYEGLDSIKLFKLESSKSSFTPFIAPSYSPEMKVLLSAGGLYTFTLDKNNPLLSRSSIPFSIGYSTNGSLTANIRANIYGKDNKWQLRATYWVKNMPDHYFGVGYNNARYIPKSDSTTAYHRDWKKLEFAFTVQVLKNFFLGFNYDAYHTKATDINPRMAEDPDYIYAGGDIAGRGLGIDFTYDSRDFAENAYKGLYIRFANTYYTEWLGSDFVYEILNLDYRQYIQIGRPRSTLAWQIKTRFTFDEVPWTEKSQLGTPFDLRGYLWGQYRDDDMTFYLVEYRRMFKRKTKNKKGNYNSPFGVVAWVGTGTITPKLEFPVYWLPNTGIGLRFEIQDRMNLRMDYGWGVNSSAFYFSFNEAF